MTAAPTICADCGTEDPVRCHVYLCEFDHCNRCGDHPDPEVIEEMYGPMDQEVLGGKV